MKKIIFIAFASLFIASHAWGAGVTLRVKEVYSNAGKSCDLDGKIEHTILLSTSSDGSVYSGWGCYYNETDSRPVNSNTFNISTSFNSSNYFTIKLEGFEGRDTSSDRCNYTNTDCAGDYHYTKFLSVNLRDYTPGVNHELLIEARSSTNTLYYRARVNLYYTIPSPVSLAISNTGIICPEGEQTLTLDYPTLPNESNLKFDYEYRIGDETKTVLEPNPAYCGPCSGGTPLSAPNSTEGGSEVGYSFRSGIPGTEKFITAPTTSPCCDEPQYIEVVKENWRTLSTGNISKQVTFAPGNLAGIDTLSENTSVTFRARARAGSYNSGYKSRTVTISPPAPTYDSYEAVASCPNGNTGSVTFKNISGTTYEYKYIIQTDVCTSPFDDTCLLNYVAHDTFTIEKPQIIIGPTGPSPTMMGGGMTSHTVNGRDLTINGLGPGSYYVYLTNVGGAKGECYTRTEFTVPAWPFPGISVSGTSNISCFGGSDGSITVSGSGGKPNTLSYSISPNLGTFDAATTTFSGLPAGTYLVSTRDECGETADVTVTLTEPSRVTGSVTSQAPDCYDPANGWVSVEAAAGSGRYNYALYAGATLVSESNNTTNNSWTVNNLPGNTYTVQVRDAVRPGCDGFDSTFVIDKPEPLALVLDSKTDLTCFESGDGKINVSGSGGTGNLTYYIKNTGTNATSNNTTGAFAGLSAGNYVAWVRNTGSACNDQFDLADTITLSQPPQITVSLTAYNITCTDADNGAIKANASGGTGVLSYRWEYNTGGGWLTYSSAADSIYNLYPAQYRVWITDELNCALRSETITLDNPEPLTITEVVRQLPACLDDSNGTLNPVATGGWGSYQYTWSGDGGSTWNKLLPATTFGFGNFLVAVTDAEGCRYQYPESIAFTAPEQELSLTLSSPAYNGYEISCAGGNTGIIEISPAGGIPLTGNTYTYYLDGVEQGTAPVLSGLTAGTYTIGVEDAYGCYKEAAITLTEPAALEVSLTRQTDVLCYGDNTGVAEFAVSGGVAPYTYTLDGEEVSSASLPDLTAQAYMFEVTDTNGCTATGSVTINSLYPPIIITFYAQDVTCYNGNDGAITTTLSGGAAPFTYEWEGISENTPDLNGLNTGWYKLQVTDAKGCKAIDSVYLAQPGNIDIGEDASICLGQEFVLDASYTGATGYNWTGPGGFSSSEASFYARQGGTYTVTVTTDLGCELTDAMELSVTGEYFNALFVAATQTAVGDTVELIEVSYPVPDRVQWDFGPGITVVDDNPARPKIIFNQTGDYSIGMTAWYAGCSDSLRKTLTSLPPEEITEPDPAEPMIVSLIQEATAYPNPNNGVFTVGVELNEITTVTVLVYDMYGNEVARARDEGADTYDIPIEVVPATPGAYVLTVIADNERFDTKVIIQ